MGDKITLSAKTGEKMTKTRKVFSAEHKLEAAQRVVDQGYTIKEASAVMGCGESTMDSWVRQLKLERQGKAPSAKAITEDARRIQDLEKRIRKLEWEKEVLKKATALLMSDSLSNLR